MEQKEPHPVFFSPKLIIKFLDDHLENIFDLNCVVCPHSTDIYFSVGMLEIYNQFKCSF